MTVRCRIRSVPVFLPRTGTPKPTRTERKITDAPLGAAAARAGDAGTGGVLPNLSGRNSSGHANLCGNEAVPVFSKTTCVTVDR